MPEKKSLVKRVTLKLHGHFAGKTVKLNGVQFTNGIVKLFGPTPEIEGLEMYLGRSYQAWPINEGENHGTGQDETIAGQGNSESISGHIQQDGAGSQKAQTDDETGIDGTDDDGGGSVPSGDGYNDSWISQASKRLEQTSSSKVEPVKLIESLKHLNPDDPTHWTSQGQPRMDAICKLYGNEGLTRRDIEAVWPEFSKDYFKETAESGN